MDEHSCLANGVDCYDVAAIHVGAGATVSQGAFLCSASHDYNSKAFELLARPIHIGAQAWLAAQVFVGPGVSVGEGAVALARAVVVKDVPPWAVVAGNPAIIVKERATH